MIMEHVQHGAIHKGCPHQGRGRGESAKCRQLRIGGGGGLVK